MPGYQLFARVLGGAAPLTEWALYGEDIAGKAENLVGNPSGLASLVTVNGYTSTRATYYYARACLKPPG
jgi:hypothetical protein